MDRLLTMFAHAITILMSALAFLVLFFAITRSASGENAMGDYLLACTLAIVPYCFAGSLHRLTIISRKPKPD